MNNERNPGDGRSRRWLLTTAGVTSATLAGCTDLLSDGDQIESSDDENGSSDSSVRWPAIDEGESLSDFETLEEWNAWETELSAAPDEARIGTQAAVIESEEREASINLRFPDGLDLREWDTSLAVKPEATERIVVEFLAPDREARLNTVRTIPDEFDGWFRLDCGYEHKPEGEPDLSNVTRINIVAVGPEDETTRLLVDDLRRTKGADNGKAILAFYGGHDSHYDIAAELLADRGWTAAAAISPDRIGDQGRMGQTQLHELQDRGWDICSYPRVSMALPEMPESRQRDVLETNRELLEDHGFEDGARHLFIPDDRMDATTNELIRDVHDSAFLFGSCTAGVPPTGMHTIPLIWGPALHNGVRRHINLADQYQLLTVLRIPRIVEDDDVGPDENRMSLDDFEHLLNHLEHRGLDVITPSDLVDGTFETDDSVDEDASDGRPEGTILEAGHSYAFEGSESSESLTIDLDDGVLSASFSHNSDGDFTVDLIADSDGRDDSLVTTSGITAGESIAAVERGTYRLEIDADGPWSIDLFQPAIHATDLDEPPVDVTGTGSGYVGPIWSDSDLRLEVTHDGDGAFIVDGYGADGSTESIVNQTGAVDNSRSYRADGTVWLNIEADGDWSLEVTDA